MVLTNIKISAYLLFLKRNYKVRNDIKKLTLVLAVASSLVACNNGNDSDPSNDGQMNQIQAGARNTNAVLASSTANSVDQLVSNDVAGSSNKCLSGSLVQTVLKGKLTSTLKVKNGCSEKQDLSSYKLAFVSEDEAGSNVILDVLASVKASNVQYNLNFALNADTQFTEEQIKINEKKCNSGEKQFCAEELQKAAELCKSDGGKSGKDAACSLANNPLVGTFSGKKNGSSAVIEANQTIEFSGVTKFGDEHEYNLNLANATFGYYSIVDQIPAFGLQVSNPISINYGNDSLVNTPTAAFGLKTVVITNATSNKIYSLFFPSKFPLDIKYDTSRTTCKLDGTQELEVKQSCNLTFKYAPQIEGVMSELPISITGVTNLDGVEDKITSSLTNIPFSSRITSQKFAGIKQSNVSLINIAINNPKSVTYGNDSIGNVPAGSSGLKSLVVTNTADFKIYAVTFPLLPDGFSYDSRTTCKTEMGNKSMLRMGQSCTLVIRYSPTVKGVTGVLPISITAVNDHYDVIANKVIDVAYSSRK